MKTDLVEIFQTIRAALQPYTALGFTNRINSDKAYDLWSEKNIEVDKEKRTESFFSSLKIKNEAVLLKIGFDHHLLDGKETISVKELDEILMKEIEETFATGYKAFKDKEWV